MQITQCLHTAILVTDLQQAEQFYSNILGLVRSPSRQLNFPGTWYQIGEFQLHLIVAPLVPSQIQAQRKMGT